MLKRTEDYAQILVAGLCKLTPLHDIKVDKKVNEFGTTLSVSGLHKKDMPFIMGKNAQNIMAIQRLVRAAGFHEDISVNLTIEEPQ